MDTLAAYITALGPADSIEVGYLPAAAPGPTDVLVRTEAMAVNNVDTLVRSGAYSTPTPFPFIIGRDLVGTVVSAGPGAAGFSEGDRVWCNSLGHGGRQGSFAQHVVVAAERLYHLPADVDLIRAVAVLHPAGTAILGLFREAQLRPGDTIVVGGGAGAVGSAVVQLAAAGGAHVIATAAGGDAEWCRTCGAWQVIDYRDQDLLAKLRDAAPGGADVYWDTSGHLDLAAIAPLLAVGAKVIITAAREPAVSLPARGYYVHDASVRCFAISNASASDLAAAARIVNSRLADNTLQPRIAARMSLSAAAEAHRRVETEHVRGRLVVLP
ncbi:MAG TPA: NADPH:quinone reductase [Streptosporangiaceae bacterium]|nr:NADPH:quinone reductase [Streptosporangiaceae bacterium]